MATPSTVAEAASLPRALALQHSLQRAATAVLGPLWTPFASFYLRVVRGYRVEGLREVREQFRRIREETSGPLLICPNHLTLIDSFLVAWALAPTWRYVLDFDSLPWNTPERRNFAATLPKRVFAYIAKCIPITRGGSREQVANVLGRVQHLLRRGELAMIFPEGGRSRSGRVDTDTPAWGVGRIVGALPGCRVLCVYLRGERQESWSAAPEQGDRLSVRLSCFEPKSDYRGARKSRDIAHQITAQLASMEREYFDGRE